MRAVDSCCPPFCHRTARKLSLKPTSARRPLFGYRYQILVADLHLEAIDIDAVETQIRVETRIEIAAFQLGLDIILLETLDRVRDMIERVQRGRCLAAFAQASRNPN